MEAREEIVNRLHAIQDQEKSIRKELNAIDYEKRFQDANQYVGKCFMEEQDSFKDHYVCFYVYGINERSCELKTMSISYFIDQDDCYQIEYYSMFKYRIDDKEDGRKYVEITREDFDKHLLEVNKRIKTALNK